MIGLIKKHVAHLLPGLARTGNRKRMGGQPPCTRGCPPAHFAQNLKKHKGDEMASCKQKMRFLTRKEARLLLKQKNLGKVYRCPFCGFWHIGHKPNRKSRAAFNISGVKKYE
jgi:hypothetical protein